MGEREGGERKDRRIGRSVGQGSNEEESRLARIRSSQSVRYPDSRLPLVSFSRQEHQATSEAKQKVRWRGGGEEGKMEQEERERGRWCRGRGSRA
eukprot:125366-Hanusia_phi.AAC.2